MKIEVNPHSGTGVSVEERVGKLLTVDRSSEDRDTNEKVRVAVDGILTGESSLSGKLFGLLNDRVFEGEGEGVNEAYKKITGAMLRDGGRFNFEDVIKKVGSDRNQARALVLLAKLCVSSAPKVANETDKVEAAGRKSYLLGQSITLLLRGQRWLREANDFQNLSLDEKRKKRAEIRAGVSREYGDIRQIEDLPTLVRSMLERLNQAYEIKRPAEEMNPKPEDTRPEGAEPEAVGEAEDDKKEGREGARVVNESEPSKEKNNEVTPAAGSAREDIKIEDIDPKLLSLYAEMAFLNIAKQCGNKTELWEVIDQMPVKDRKDEVMQGLMKGFTRRGSRYDRHLYSNKKGLLIRMIEKTRLYKFKERSTQEKIDDRKLQIGRMIDQRKEELKRQGKETVRSKEERRARDTDLTEMAELEGYLKAEGESLAGGDWERLAEDNRVVEKLQSSSLPDSKKGQIIKYLNNGLYWDIVDYDTLQYGDNAQAKFQRTMVSIKNVLRRVPGWNYLHQRRQSAREEAIKIIAESNPVIAKKLRHLTLIEQREYGLK